MKVKLLKKVRKRFSIIHMPNGYVDYSGNHYDYNLYKLSDNTDTYGWNEKWAQLGVKGEVNYVKEVFQTDAECIDYLRGRIIKRLRSEGFRGRKDNVINGSFKKVWYK
jgi:hypothetical protein